jgi:Serine carboxypeptidase S28
MMTRLFLVLLLCSTISLAFHTELESHILNNLGAQGVNLWQLNAFESSSASNLGSSLLVHQSSSFTAEEQYGFTPQWFIQPLDHFSSSGHTFRQRFWINSRHYNPEAGGPVFVLDSGETSGEDRLPFLDTGIMEILARATGGISVVLEHRYYGTWPLSWGFCA